MHHTLSVEVRDNGRLEILLPSLKSGQIVQVTLDVNLSAPRERQIGLLTDRIRFSDAFDEPMEEFRPYS